MEKLTAFIITLFLFISCKEGVIEKEVKNDEIQLINGRLKFNDDEHLQNTLLELKGMSPSDLEKWSNKFPSFISQKEKFKSLTNEEKQIIVSNGGSDAVFLSNMDGEMEALMQVEDRILSLIANYEGIVLIGSVARKYERERIITIESFSDEKLKSYKKGEQISGVTVRNVNRSNARLLSALPNEDSRHKI